ncbi:MAG: hypothetical protein E7629_07215 [Ruminococcaceae bacterium]|nr:hypothetical protein [Oscillospiraceae bacterium]
MENLKNPCSACLFTFSESNLHRGKALGFLLADCGNLFLSSLFSFAKTRFFSQNSFLEFSTFFSTTVFPLFHGEKSKIALFGFFYKFSTGMTLFLSTAKSLFLKRIFTGENVEKFW